MADLRTELHAYASNDEPPLGLRFDEVLTAARRARQRRRSAVIASCVAGVAVVVAAVPALLSLAAPNSPPATGVAACTPKADTKARLSCVLRELLTAELPLGARLERGDYVRDADPQGGPLDFAQFQIPPGRNSEPAGTGYTMQVTLPDPPGEITVEVGPASFPRPCVPAGTCEHRQGPHGEQVTVSRIPQALAPGAQQTLVNSFHNGISVEVRTANNLRFHLAGPDVVGLPDGPLSIDAMVKIATTPELRP